MKKLLIITFISFSSFTYGQGNCLIYKEGSNERKACELAYEGKSLKAVNCQPSFCWEDP